MNLAITIVLFCVGLVLLIKGGDWFVDGSVGLAKRFNIPEILIGATVVSIGTTLPEVMVSSIAAGGGNGQIAYGNAIGSVICNTALIAALTVAIRPSKVDRGALKVPVIFFFVAAAIYCAFSYFVGTFSRLTGIILLTLFLIYMIYSVYTAKKLPEKTETEAEETENEKPTTLSKEIILLLLGAAAIAVGAKLLVDNGTKFAEAAHVPDSVIGLTFVALGTSLPELVTAITALAKGHSALSLGNIVGANLFNLVLVSGLSTVIGPFDVPAANKFMGYNTSLIIEIPLMVTVMAILTLPALIKGKLSRAQGIILLLIYAAFCVFQFAM